MKTEELESAYLIGDEAERIVYFPAVIGVSKDLCRVVYNLDKLAECFVNANEDWTMEDAYEWIDYNVMRSLPYIPEQYRPIITEKTRINRNNSQFMPMALDS